MPDAASTAHSRATYSAVRLNELRNHLAPLAELNNLPELTIFGAGSYARHEASEFSDIDMFFINEGARVNVPELRTKSLRLFGKIIDIIDKMNFPKFSNDCEYLTILHVDEILQNLGSRTDDHENFFTARMLLLLESKCLFGDAVFSDVKRRVIESYFVDFPDHKETFQPTFLLNDICRFWKTLLLNYENKRNLPGGVKAEEPERKIKQKVRNFKLKYSRMTTCFASIAALGSHNTPVTIEQVFELTEMTPRERLESVAARLPTTRDAVSEVLSQYAWFLEMTGLPTQRLEDHFSDKERRIEMFRKANAYGDTMFQLLQVIDREGQGERLLRTLVI
jgi:predicted nucleotidyltransferase